MKKNTLNLIIGLSSILALSSCTTLNPMMSYVQAGVKTTAHKVKSKQRTTKDPHISFLPNASLVPLHLRAKFLQIQPNITVPEVSLAISFQANRFEPLTNFNIEPTFEETTEVVRQGLVEYAKNFLGVRYRSGGKSAKGFDCSGFTSYVMSNFGYNVPSASVRQAQIGETIAIEDAKKGDLVFFGHKNKKGGYRVSHAAMVVSEAGETFAMIHASRRGIVIDDMNSSAWRKYYSKKFMHVKRVVHLEELIVKK